MVVETGPGSQVVPLGEAPCSVSEGSLLTVATRPLFRSCVFACAVHFLINYILRGRRKTPIGPSWAPGIRGSKGLYICFTKRGTVILLGHLQKCWLGPAKSSCPKRVSSWQGQHLVILRVLLKRSTRSAMPRRRSVSNASGTFFRGRHSVL